MESPSSVSASSSLTLALTSPASTIAIRLEHCDQKCLFLVLPPPIWFQSRNPFRIIEGLSQALQREETGWQQPGIAILCFLALVQEKESSLSAQRFMGKKKVIVALMYSTISPPLLVANLTVISVLYSFTLFENCHVVHCVADLRSERCCIIGRRELPPV